MSEYFENTAWLKQRLGRFTASEIHKIFCSGTRPMTEDELKREKEAKGKRKTVDTIFGEGARTYILEKAAELHTMVIKQKIDFKQAEWGFMHEHDALLSFQEYVGKEFIYYGCSNPKFFKHGDYAGGSPDFEDASEGGDLKCPYNTHEHIKNLRIKSIEEFKDLRWEYYCQLQMNMYIRNWTRSHFVSYDPRMIEKRLQLKHIVVEPDLEWIKEYELRLPAATEELSEILSSLENYQIGNPTLIVSGDTVNDTNILLIDKK